MDLMPHLRGNAAASERTVFWRSTRWGVQHAVRRETGSICKSRVANISSTLAGTL
jgi:hypothetical protein